MYPRKELNYLADDLANRSEWVDILFTALHYRMEMEQQEASELLENMILDIVNGDTLDVLMKKLEMCAGRKIDIALHTEMWIVLTGLMLEKELPILKGRSRMQYAEEKNVSAWSVGMLDGLYSIKDEKRCHMYEFSTEIQENMFYADNYGESEKIEQLLEYQENNDICSEEFLYLLAKACITFGETESAERLIGKLKKVLPGEKRLRSVYRKTSRNVMMSLMTNRNGMRCRMYPGSGMNRRYSSRW